MLSFLLRSLFLVSMLILPKALYAEPNPVTGMIDAIYYDNPSYPAFPRHHVAGWACAYGLPQSIAVHIYAGGPAGTGHFVTQAWANLPSDQAVANVCGSTGTAYRFDIDLYLLLAENFGQPLYIHGISPNGGPNWLIGNSGAFNFPDGITATVFGDPMVIRTPSTLGGAIGSITWRGKEFVNSSDHGREFQVAASFNGDNECYNPTEAGSASDGAGTSPSTSLVSKYKISQPNQFFTTNYPAFWMWPGQTELSPDGMTRYFYCREDVANQAAVNTTARSNFQFYKTVTVGAFGMQNVIQVDTAVWLPEAVSYAAIESLVGCLNNADFPQVMTYDVVNKTATTIDDPNQYPYGQSFGTRPAIFASADGQYALGVYNQQINHSMNPSTGDHYRIGRSLDYGVNSFSSTLVFGSTSGPYSWSFTNYVVIGTLQDVLASMDALHTNLP